MSKTILMLGGPLDGKRVPNEGYFEEGDVEAVETLAYREADPKWSKESVYRVEGGVLIYDEKATKRRRLITTAKGDC